MVERAFAAVSTASAGMDEIDENPFGYGARVWALFKDAPRAGEFAAETPGVVTGQAGTPAARSVLRLQLKFTQDRVADARFRAYGCPTSIAVGAWIAEWSLEKSAGELARLTTPMLRAALEIPDERAHCALMGEDALRAVLAHLKQEKT